jgi:hypothetical protein
MITEFHVQHVERCMETRLESYQGAYAEAKAVPTDEEFKQVWKSVQEAQQDQIGFSGQALQQFLKSRGIDGDPKETLRALSARGHDRVLGKWKIWQGQVQLRQKRVSDEPRDLEKSVFRRWADVLWPLGSTLLALIGVPVAIEQYPEFFRQNAWILPTCACVVVVCWIVPVVLHERAKRWYKRTASLPRVGGLAAPVIALGLLALLILGSVKLLRFHRNHLAAALRKDHGPAEQGHTSGTHTEGSPPSRNGSTASPAKSKASRGDQLVALIFKDSPLFTKERRETITNDINGFATYLERLGVPIPIDIPPIGIDTTNPKAVGWSFNGQSNNKYYYNKFTLQQGMLDDRQKITEAFCNFVIGRFVYKPPPTMVPFSEKQTPQEFYDATHTPEQMDQSYRWMAGVPLTQYLNHSYWNQHFAKNQQPVCPDQGDGTAYYFWKIRMRFGREFTDRLAVFTLRAIVDKPYNDPTQHYRQYFYERLKMADSVIDNENAKMPGIDAVLKECRWLPN